MATIDFTSAYRDATQGSTLKALAARRAEMQAANAAMKPREVKSPWQGAANIADTISGAIREGRIANDEAKGRARFAELLAGGLAPDEIGEAMGLDPDTTMKYQERTWAQEDKTSDRTYTEGREKLKNDWDVAAAAARAKEARDLAEQQDKAQITLADHNATIEEKQHAQEVIDNAKVAETTAETASKQAVQGSDLRIKEDAAKAETFRPLTPEDVKAWPETQAHPEDWKFNNRTGAPEPINPSQFSAADQEKRTFDTKTKLTTVDIGLDALHRAMELAPDVTEFGAVGRTVLSPSGMLPESWQPDAYKKTAEATKRFDQIMKSNAITQMAVQLSGTDSDKDVQRFIEIMADPDSTLSLKRQTISNMINRLQQERVTQAERLKGITGEDYGKYTYKNPDVMTGDTAATGGGTEAPPSEDDIQETMRANNMTREQVMDALAEQKAGGR